MLARKINEEENSSECNSFKEKQDFLEGVYHEMRNEKKEANFVQINLNSLP